MTTNLRVSLTILSIGFAIEGAGEAYTRFVGGTTPPGASFLYVLPLALTGLGLLFVWVGREEWNEVHRARVGHATRAFGYSILGGIVAAALLALLVAEPAIGTPGWARILFGAAVASLVFGTFLTYALLVFHLTSVAGRAAVGAALLWALIISVAVTLALASDLPSILTIVQKRTLSVPSFVAPVDSLLSYLFLSYFLLLVAYIDAHAAVARGLAPPTNAGRVSGASSETAKGPEGLTKPN